MNWLKKVVESTVESESPEKFFYWSALSAISAVVRKNVFLDRFFYKLYPNIFVLIIGPSGVRKGVPVALAKALVDNVKCTRVIHGRSSIQGVVKELSRVCQLSDGTILNEAHGFIHSSEFSAFLVKDPDALTILTDLYDTHFNDEWNSTLKHSPIDHLKSVCVTLLGASNEEHLKDIIPSNAIGGGMVARTFMVHCETIRGVNSLITRPSVIPDIKELSHHLFKVASAKGEFKWSDKGAQLYSDWYSDFRKNKKMDATGTLDRIQDGILKVAMLVSLSKNIDLVLEESDVQEALNESLDCISGMKKIILGIGGKAEYAEKTGLVLKALLGKPPLYEMSRQRILSKYWGDLDSLDLDRVIETMVQAEVVTAERRGTDIFYKLTPKTLKTYLEVK